MKPNTARARKPIVLLAIIISILLESNGAARMIRADDSPARAGEIPTIEAQPGAYEAQNSTAPASSLSPNDQRFVLNAARDGVMQILLGRTALDKATSSDVKSFAQRVIEDVSVANTELQQLATRKGLILPASDLVLINQSAPGFSSTARLEAPSGPDNKIRSETHRKVLSKQRKMDKVAGLSGSVFERKYVYAMVKDYEKNVRVFEKQSVHGNDPDVRAWVAKALPTIRERLQQVRDIQSRLKS